MSTPREILKIDPGARMEYGPVAMTGEFVSVKLPSPAEVASGVGLRGGYGLGGELILAQHLATGVTGWGLTAEEALKNLEAALREKGPTAQRSPGGAGQ